MKKSSITLIFVFLFIIVGGATLWWLFIDWAKDASDSGKQWATDGKAYGRSNTASACLDRVLALDEQCDGITCGIHNRVFLTSCLKSSQQDPGFCNGVPSSYSILEAAAWEISQCEQINNEKQTCPHLFRAVHTYCTTRNEHKAVPRS